MLEATANSFKNRGELLEHNTFGLVQRCTCIELRVVDRFGSFSANSRQSKAARGHFKAFLGGFRAHLRHHSATIGNTD